MRNITNNTSAYIIELLSLLFVAATVLLVLLNYADMPDKIITHYNINGIQDGYGDKSSILYLTGISIVMYAGLTFLQKRPGIYNFPVKVTEANKAQLYSYGTKMVRLLKLFISALFCYIAYSSVQNQAMGSFITIIIVIAPASMLIYYIVKMMKCRE